MDNQLGYNGASLNSLGVSGKHLVSVIPKLQRVKTAGDVRVGCRCYYVLKNHIGLCISVTFCIPVIFQSQEVWGTVLRKNKFDKVANSKMYKP